MTAIFHASFLNFQSSSHLARHTQRRKMNWPNEELRNARPSHQRLHFKVIPHLVGGLCHPLDKVASGVWQVESEVSPRETPSGYHIKPDSIR